MRYSNYHANFISPGLTLAWEMNSKEKVYGELHLQNSLAPINLSLIHDISIPTFYQPAIIKPYSSVWFRRQFTTLDTNGHTKDQHQCWRQQPQGLETPFRARRIRAVSAPSKWHGPTLSTDLCRYLCQGDALQIVYDQNTDHSGWSCWMTEHHLSTRHTSYPCFGYLLLGEQGILQSGGDPRPSAVPRN